jgi:hypothetical protein
MCLKLRNGKPWDLRGLILKEKPKVQSNQFIAIAGCPSVKNQYNFYFYFCGVFEGHLPWMNQTPTTLVSW